ncbi:MULTISPECIES: type III polyketide synthase [Acidocella]|uniref:type III polyketide synthase n=1 Tax=Acidocella TaxID=50709 RepID=UPI00028EBC93|nr:MULTISPECIES: type III polyketide synthase [Acidocella]EKM98537.1 naringenin-chalcone synthase [Acidocella sp. MX-AZ02]WBO59093.1 type III polyketide synthase [Acidocella sp. MX-AZ03]
MTQAYINRIGTARPPHDVHAAFQDYTARGLPDERQRALFHRMARRAGISHRYSVLHQDGMVEAAAPTPGFYRRGAFPGTAARMRTYAAHAPALAEQAVSQLDLQGRAQEITHLVVASCTGFMAPGLDQILAARLGLRVDLQRTMVGFMGCAAAVPALRIAQAAVLADPAARVLVVNLELCTLHMQETDALEVALTFLLFGDGATAALVTAEPHGFALEDFRSVLIPDSEDFISWHVGDQGFVMHLSGQVPGRIAAALRAAPDFILRGEGTQALQLWAVHGGGRSVLDAVEGAFGLEETALAPSRAVLDAHGNMSSATIMFVLAGMLKTAPPGQRGLAMAFGPGMVTETFRFTAR